MSDEGAVAVAPAPAKPVRGRAQTADRKKRALEMALAGASYDAIAKELGWKNKSSAFRAVQAAMREWAPVDEDDVRTLRARELARMDRLQQAHWLTALRGDARATELVLRISQHRSRLLGLDAPIKVEGTLGSQLDQEINELLAALPRPDKG